MDIVFDCPNCEQELAVDSAGAGSEIECPSCGETITIPEKSTKVATVETPAPVSGEAPAPGLAPSAINSSAAAKVQMHLKVPVSDRPGASLIRRAAVPLAVTAKGGDKQIRVRTIRHDKCIESGHDKFDEVVTEFLDEVGEANIVGIHAISFSHVDVGSQKLLTDYGLLVIYRG
jgi:DNA-directed RNA polymerase subunit RPC12/RpoP